MKKMRRIYPADLNPKSSFRKIMDAEYYSILNGKVDAINEKKFNEEYYARAEQWKKQAEEWEKSRITKNNGYTLEKYTEILEENLSWRSNLPDLGDIKDLIKNKYEDNVDVRIAEYEILDEKNATPVYEEDPEIKARREQMEKTMAELDAAAEDWKKALEDFI